MAIRLLGALGLFVLAHGQPPNSRNQPSGANQGNSDNAQSIVIPSNDPEPNSASLQQPASLALDVKELVPLSKGCGRWNIVKYCYGACNTEYCSNDDMLKVTYPKDSYRPRGPNIGGVGFYSCPSCFPSLEATLSFELRPNDDFEWVKGGKLPGLFIGEPGASGGRHSDEKASCRVMWRANGQAEAYVYLPPAAVQPVEYSQIPKLIRNPVYGDSLWRGLFKFTKGEWNSVSMTVRLNTVTGSGPVADGGLSMTVNGVTQSFDKIVWRLSNDLFVQGISFETFFGGSDQSWATPLETHTGFRNVAVSCCSMGYLG